MNVSRSKCAFISTNEYVYVIKQKLGMQWCLKLIFETFDIITRNYPDIETRLKQSFPLDDNKLNWMKLPLSNS